MRLLPLVFAAALAASAVAIAADPGKPLVDPKEPPKTPANAPVETPISAAAVLGAAIGLGVIIAIASGGGDSAQAATPATGTN